MIYRARTLWFKLATNAGLHGKEFWTEVGKQFVRSNVKPLNNGSTGRHY